MSEYSGKVLGESVMWKIGKFTYFTRRFRAAFLRITPPETVRNPVHVYVDTDTSVTDGI